MPVTSGDGSESYRLMLQSNADNATAARLNAEAAKLNTVIVARKLGLHHGAVESEKGTEGDGKM